MFGRVQKSGRIRRVLSKTCVECNTAVGYSESVCGHCGTGRPEAGWDELDALVDPWLGRLIHDRYLLRRRIGHGASGRVYLASMHPTDHAVAIKLINLRSEPAGQDAGDAKRRFEREIAALAHLNSPHVLQLIDVVELAEDYVGLVTDFVDGHTLGQVLDRSGRLEMARAVELGSQIADALGQVHAAGVAHRDLKPDNIIVEQLHRDDEMIHLIDFGIAHICGEVSKTHGFVGTPLYASPEQSRGDEIDVRTDVYSLGAVLFHLLTGRPPFTGTNPYQLLHKHVTQTAPALAEVAGDRDFPEDLERLVADMLRKAPSQRPASMHEVAERLRGIAPHLGARASGDGRGHAPSAAILAGSRVIPYERSPRVVAPMQNHPADPQRTRDDSSAQDTCINWRVRHS
ncbi:serine/threonine protein kinase [Persicimonas caeni]|uniref:Serine/threonine protein kinase n=1 Tax=Persicimonas caeni TaxID=2292766 RepID=A0A4Y6PVK1_PERCE|nr:serine/threonine protein kinase [Persicimonas caeni]QED33238.1 serine/threonine protein kinase [Persicimonas caeni]